MLPQIRGCYAPQQPIIQMERKYPAKLLSIINNINKVAIPAIALFVLSNIGVNAGPMAYAVCVEACFLGFAWCPPLLPACTIGCIPLLAAPTP